MRKETGQRVGGLFGPRPDERARLAFPTREEGLGSAPFSCQPDLSIQVFLLTRNGSENRKWFQLIVPDGESTRSTQPRHRRPGSDLTSGLKKGKPLTGSGNGALWHPELTAVHRSLAAPFIFHLHLNVWGRNWGELKVPTQTLKNTQRAARLPPCTETVPGLVCK